MSLIAKEKCKRCRLKKKLIEEGTMLRKLKIKNRGQFSQSENYQSYKMGEIILMVYRGHFLERQHSINR